MIRSIRRLIALTLVLAMMAVTGAMPAAAYGTAPCATMPMASGAMSSDHRGPSGHHAMIGVGCGDCCIVVPPLAASIVRALPIPGVTRIAMMPVAFGWAVAPPLPPPRG